MNLSTKTDIEEILKDSENKLISELQKDEYLISEHDIQSLHFCILRKKLNEFNKLIGPKYAVSTEWTYYNEDNHQKSIYRFDLVVFNNESKQNKNKPHYIKKDIYVENSQKLLYIAEYKVDTAHKLQPKQINAFNS